MASVGAYASPTYRAPLRWGYSVCTATTDVLLLCVVLWSTLPETIFGEKIRLAGLPVDFVLWYCVVLSALSELLLSGGLAKRFSPALSVATALLVLMSIHGVVHRAELKWWVIDVTHCSGLILGLYWGANRSVERIVKAVVRFGCVGAAMLVVNVLGLLLGVVPPVHYGRVYTYGMFNASYFVSVTLPLCITTARFCSSSKVVANVRLAMCVGVSCLVFVVSFFCATRGMLILMLIAGLLAFWVAKKKSDVALGYLAVFAVFTLCVLLGDQFGVLSNTQLLERFSARAFEEEERYIEVEMMFEDMSTSSDWWLGKGFGSRFLTCVVVEGEDLAVAPHVAVLTTLFKGGMMSFLFVVILPSLRAVFRLLVGGRSRLQLACSGGMLIYVIAACMSGGWSFLSLFFYGTFWSLSNRNIQEFEA